jgi:hypothetical protein
MAMFNLSIAFDGKNAISKKAASTFPIIKLALVKGLLC